MVTGGSIFPHKDIHKATWRSSVHVTENQFDHVCIGQKFRLARQDVRVKRGCRHIVGPPSGDGHPKLHLKRCPVEKNPRARYNMDHMKDRGTAGSFHLSLTNKLQAIQELYEDNRTDLEAKWV